MQGDWCKDSSTTGILRKNILDVDSEFNSWLKIRPDYRSLTNQLQAHEDVKDFLETMCPWFLDEHLYWDSQIKRRVSPVERCAQTRGYDVKSCSDQQKMKEEMCAAGIVATPRPLPHPPPRCKN